MNNKTLKRAQIIRADYALYIGEYEGQLYQLQVTGRFRYLAVSKTDYPTVGDYVFFHSMSDNTGIIERIEKRKSSLKRQAVSHIPDAQIIASNVDICFIVMSCNNDFNRTKLDDLISMTYTDNIEQVILLSKSDLANDGINYLELTQSYTDLPVMMVSIYDEETLTALEQKIATNTCVFVGSSGVGKSSLINSILGEAHFDTQEIRESDAQGRHTTSHRELIHTPSGGKIIDTPGIRVINSYQIEHLDEHFSDVSEYASSCRFRDCTHNHEPGCSVQSAIEQGDLEEERLEQYRKAERFNAHTRRQEAHKKRLLDKKLHRR